MIVRDAALLARLHAESFAGKEVWDAAAMTALLDTPGTFAFVSPGGDGIAMVRVAADEAELITLAVLPTARRRGVGTTLLGEIMRESRARGAARLFLEVSADNAAARTLYAGSGFSEVGRRRRYYVDGSDALIMAARLDAPCGSAAE